MPFSAPIVVPAARANPLLKLLIGGIVLLPMVAWLLAAHGLQQRALSEANEQILRASDVLRERAIKTFEIQELTAIFARDLLAGLSDSEILSRAPELSQRLKLATEKLDQLRDIWVLDAAGKPLLSTNFQPVPHETSLADREYFTVHRDGDYAPGRLYISKVMHGRGDQSAVFFKTSIGRYAPSGEFLGVIALSVDPKYFRDFYARFTMTGLAVLTLTRDDGNLLARYPPIPDPVARMPLGSGFMTAISESRERGIYRTVSVFDKVERIIAYNRLPKYPVYVTASINRSQVIAAARAEAASHLYFGIPAIGLLVLMASLVARGRRRELLALERLKQEIDRRQRLQREAYQTQKLEAIGRLASGVAHDFNNLLSAIGGSISALRRAPLEPKRRDILLDRAQEGLKLGANLTQQLLSFARTQHIQLSCVDANQIAQGATDLASMSLPSNIALKFRPHYGAAWIETDIPLLSSAIMNLCTNARDALPDGGSISVSVSAEAEAAHLAHGLPGPCCVVMVADTGLGMPPDVLARAMEPFFTTKGESTGTGLGLSQVNALMEMSGGKFVLRSEPGRGTTAILVFPAAQGGPVSFES